MTTAMILFLDLLNLFLLFRFILGCEFRKTRSSVVIGVGIIIATFVVMLFYIDVLPYNVSWLFSHSICILPMIFLKGNRWNLFGLGVAYWVISMSMIYLVEGLMMVILKGQIDFDDFGWYSISGEIVTTVIFCLLIAFFYDKKDRIHEVVISVNPLIYILFSFILYFVSLDWGYFGALDSDTSLAYQGANEAKDAVTAFITIGFMFAVIFIFFQKKRLKQEVLLKERCIEEQVEQYRLMGNANEESKKFRHDFNKHLDTLTSLYDKGEMEELGQYLRQIYDVKEKAFYISTGNMICDAIANQYYKKCKDAGIKLQFNGFFPERMAVAMTDLCVILSNALDNAYEAACKCAGEQVIECKVGNQGDFLFITIWNQTSAEPVIADGYILTTKQDKERHGLGTKNMQEAAARNNGKVWWEYDKSSRMVATNIRLRGQKLEEKGKN